MNDNNQLPSWKEMHDFRVCGLRRTCMFRKVIEFYNLEKLRVQDKTSWGFFLFPFFSNKGLQIKTRKINFMLLLSIMSTLWFISWFSPPFCQSLPLFSFRPVKVERASLWVIRALAPSLPPAFGLPSLPRRDGNRAPQGRNGKERAPITLGTPF